MHYRYMSPKKPLDSTSVALSDEALDEVVGGRFKSVAVINPDSIRPSPLKKRRRRVLRAKFISLAAKISAGPTPHP